MHLVVSLYRDYVLDLSVWSINWTCTAHFSQCDLKKLCSRDVIENLFREFKGKSLNAHTRVIYRKVHEKKEKNIRNYTFFSLAEFVIKNEYYHQNFDENSVIIWFNRFYFILHYLMWWLYGIWRYQTSNII